MTAKPKACPEISGSGFSCEERRRQGGASPFCADAAYVVPQRKSHASIIYGQALRFTLIELLVVVAIISILMALLLPALGMAKKQGLDLACRANLKQMGIASMSYAGDYNEWCVSAKPAALTGNSWPMAFYYLYYIRTKETFKCPAEQIYEFTEQRVNYGINYYTFGLGPAHAQALPQRIQNVSKFNRDATVIYYIDTPPTDYASVGIGFSTTKSILATGASGAYPVTSAGKWYPPYARHNFKANAVMFDGHVDALSVNDLTYNAKAYWNPTQYATAQVLSISF